jgi:hypothetical protein
MDRNGSGSGRMPGGGARFRFVHSLEDVRGIELMAEACPFEEHCDTAPNGEPGFKALAAARRFSAARPYFRGRRPMAFACSAAQGPACWGCPLAAQTPSTATPFGTVRPSYGERISPVTRPIQVPQAPPRPVVLPAAVPEMPRLRREPEPLLRAAGSQSSARRTIP